MKTFFVKVFTIFLLFSCGENSNQSQFTSDGSASDLGGDIRVSTDYSTNVITSNDWKTHVESYGLIRIDAKLAKSIKAVIKLRLKASLSSKGLKIEDDPNLEKWIEEAYIIIRKVGVTPVAFVVGKHRVAFGQSFSDMPMHEENSPLIDKSKIDQVIGFTLSLSNVPFFDLVEMSVFETGKGDLVVGAVEARSVRLSKNLTKKIKSQVPLKHNGNEKAHSIGFVYDDGDWTFWVEGIFYSQKEYGYVFGASKPFMNGTIACEFNYIRESIMQYGIGYKYWINKKVSVGPEIRYSQRINYQDEFVFGLKTSLIYR